MLLKKRIIGKHLILVETTTDSEVIINGQLRLLYKNVCTNEELKVVLPMAQAYSAYDQFVKKHLNNKAAA